MKKLIAILLFAVSTMVHANCMTSTYIINGRMVVCTTCCYGTICNTNCF